MLINTHLVCKLHTFFHSFVSSTCFRCRDPSICYRPPWTPCCQHILKIKIMNWICLFGQIRSFGWIIIDDVIFDLYVTYFVEMGLLLFLVLETEWVPAQLFLVPVIGLVMEQLFPVPAIVSLGSVLLALVWLGAVLLGVVLWVPGLWGLVLLVLVS